VPAGRDALFRPDTTRTAFRHREPAWKDLGNAATPFGIRAGRHALAAGF
jgi:hypothetical protein